MKIKNLDFSQFSFNNDSLIAESMLFGPDIHSVRRLQAMIRSFNIERNTVEETASFINYCSQLYGWCLLKNFSIADKSSIYHLELSNGQTINPIEIVKNYLFKKNANSLVEVYISLVVDYANNHPVNSQMSREAIVFEKLTCLSEHLGILLPESVKIASQTKKLSDYGRTDQLNYTENYESVTISENDLKTGIRIIEFLNRMELFDPEIPSYDEVFELLELKSTQEETEVLFENIRKRVIANVEPIELLDLSNRYLKWEPQYCKEDGSRDLESAYYWLRASADVGCTESYQLLGMAYYLGLFDIKNPEQAFYWIEKSAKLGNWESMIYLSHFYDEGIGVKEDPDKCKEWFDEAVRVGGNKVVDFFLNQNE